MADPNPGLRGHALDDDRARYVARFLDSLLIPWLVVGLAGVAVLLWQDVRNGLSPMRSVLFAGICLVGVAALGARTLGLWKRARLVIGILMGIGILGLVHAPLLPGGVIFCGAAVLVASIVFGHWGMALLLALSVGAYSLAAMAAVSGTMGPFQIISRDPSDALTWVRVGTVSLLPLAAVAAGIVAILQGLQVALDQAGDALTRARESEWRFRSVMEQSNDAVVCYEFDPPIDTDGPTEEQVAMIGEAMIAEINETCCRLYGIGHPAQALGKRLGELPNGDSGRRARHYRAFVESGYHLTDYEYLEALDSGKEHWLRVDARGVIQDHRLVRTWITLTDVTDARRAQEAVRATEERYRALFAAVGDVAFVHELLAGGVPGRFLEVNDVACRLLGYRRDELLAMGPRDLAGPTNPVEPTFVLDNYASGKPATFETFHRARDGRLIPVEIHGSPFSFKGQPAVMALARDVSERKRAERELRRLHMRIETIRTEESRRLARRVHDDVGQSLTALQLDLSNLRRQIDPTHDAQAAIKAAASLLRETLETVRGVSQDLHPRILDDLGLGAAVKAQARRLAEPAGLALHLDISPGEIALDRLSYEALYRVYREALTNVVRLAAARNVWIHLRHTATQVELVVEDDGRGLPQQVETTRRSLGLLYMRESMRALGGSCNVTSTPGGGTRVTAEMPTETSSGPGQGST